MTYMFILKCALKLVLKKVILHVSECLCVGFNDDWGQFVNFW